MKTVSARFEGRNVRATPTGNDHKGRPYSGSGYREATIRVHGKVVLGRLCWLSGGWQFEEFRRKA